MPLRDPSMKEPPGSGIPYSLASLSNFLNQDLIEVSAFVYECKKACGSYKWLDLWSAVELERTNNDANGFSFPEYQLVTQFLGICVGQCWPLSDYVTITIAAARVFLRSQESRSSNDLRRI